MNSGPPDSYFCALTGLKDWPALRIVLNLLLIKLNMYVYILILIFEDLKFNLVQIEICKYINSISVICLISLKRGHTWFSPGSGPVQVQLK